MRLAVLMALDSLALATLSHHITFSERVLSCAQTSAADHGIWLGHVAMDWSMTLHYSMFLQVAAML